MVSLLTTYLDACRPKRFDWQEWNCVHFIAGWVRMVEGRDILAQYVDRTATMLCAARLARRLGGLPTAMSHALGREPVPVIQAQLGDVAYLEGRGTAGTLAICNGASAVALLDLGPGFVTVPMQTFTHVWKLQREIQAD